MGLQLFIGTSDERMKFQASRSMLVKIYPITEVMDAVNFKWSSQPVKFLGVDERNINNDEVRIRSLHDNPRHQGVLNHDVLFVIIDGIVVYAREILF